MKMYQLRSPLMGLLLLLFSSSVSGDNVSRIRKQKVQVESADLEKFVLQDDDAEMLKENRGVRSGNDRKKSARRTETNFFFPSAIDNLKVGSSKGGGSQSVWDSLLLSMDTSPTPAPNNPATSHPTNLACMGLSRSEAMLSILSEVSDEMKLLQPNTPQGVAYLWMLDGDSAMVDPCTYATVKQRFALASFFYSAGGNFWAFDTAWLSSANECEWMGVNCDDGKSVTGLRLGTYRPRVVCCCTGTNCRWFQVHNMPLERLMPFHLFCLLTSLTKLQ